jgi:hypothetical protein
MNALELAWHVAAVETWFLDAVIIDSLEEPRGCLRE